MPSTPTRASRADVQAATRIQRFARSMAASRRGRWLVAQWPSLERIKAKLEVERLLPRYLDEEAKRAGAEGTKFYTDEQILERESVRSNSMVVKALDFAWTAVVSATSLPDGVDMLEVLPCRWNEAQLTASAPSSDTRVSACGQRDAYLSMARRIYLVLSLRSERSQRISPKDALTSAVKDFETDADVSGGRAPSDAGKALAVSRASFHSSWFQLADINTIGVGNALYASFIYDLVKQIARPRLIDGRTDGWEWRDDRAIWAESSAKACSHAILKAHPPSARKLSGSDLTFKRVRAASAFRRATVNLQHTPNNDIATKSTVAALLPRSSEPTHAASREVGGGVWARLMWLSAFEASRAAEQLSERARERKRLDEVNSRPPSAIRSSPSAPVPRSASEAALSRVVAHAARQHSLPRGGRSRATSFDAVSGICGGPRPESTSSLAAALANARAMAKDPNVDGQNRELCGLKGANSVRRGPLQPILPPASPVASTASPRKFEPAEVTLPPRRYIASRPSMLARLDSGVQLVTA